MTDEPDYSRSFGGEALGARLWRASERIDRDGTRVYAARGVRFEQRWYGIVRQLVANGPMSIGDLAAVLRITHASVSETSRSLERAGLVASAPAATDGRRRNLVLTDKARALVEELTPVWEAFNASADELNAEAGDLVALLDQLDDALARRSMFDRIMSRLDKPEVED